MIGGYEPEQGIDASGIDEPYHVQYIIAISVNGIEIKRSLRYFIELNRGSETGRHIDGPLKGKGIYRTEACRIWQLPVISYGWNADDHIIRRDILQ